MKFRLGPMHSEIWPWTKIEGQRHVRSWFIFRLCQLFPGRTFFGHTVIRR